MVAMIVNMNTLGEKLIMNKRQKLLDAVRLVRQEVVNELKTAKFTKDVEKFQLQEAVNNLNFTEKHLMGYLQVDKSYGK